MAKKIYLLVESLLCVILAGALILAAIQIYREGVIIKAADPLESIFTREKIAGKLSEIAPIFIIFAVMTLAGIICGVESSYKREKIFMTSQTRNNYKNFQVIIIIASICLIIAGIFNGSALDVLYKSVNICSECIGLG